jgi:hypothetical protein
VLSGSVPIDKIQVDYTEMINKGLQKGDLIRIENMILVKENIKRNEEQ